MLKWFTSKPERRFRVLYVGTPQRAAVRQWSVPLTYDDAMARYATLGDAYEVVEVIARKPEKS